MRIIKYVQQIYNDFGRLESFFFSTNLIVAEDVESSANLLLLALNLLFGFFFFVHTRLGISAFNISDPHGAKVKLLHEHITFTNIEDSAYSIATKCLCWDKNVFFNSWWQYVHVDGKQQPTEAFGEWRLVEEMEARTYTFPGNIVEYLIEYTFICNTFFLRCGIFAYLQTINSFTILLGDTFYIDYRLSAVCAFRNHAVMPMQEPQSIEISKCDSKSHSDINRPLFIFAGLRTTY